MKSLKMFSKVICLIMLTAFILTPVSVFAAADPADLSHETHVDRDGDGLCDITGCDEKLPCEHIDVNEDGKCDIDGCGACLSHTDEDGDGQCDTDGCAEKLEAEASWKDNVWESVKMFIIGMIGIFLVVGIIILVIYALTSAINGTKKKNDGEQ